MTASSRRRVCAWLIALVLAIAARGVMAASDHYGQVTFAGLPVPGATVTATQGEQTVVAVTDEQGVYRLPALADGPWNVRVELLGFSPEARDVVMAADAPPAAWALTLLSFEAIVRNLPPPSDAGTAAAGSRGPDAGPAGAKPGSGAAASAPGSGFQRAAVNPAAAPVPAAASELPATPAAPADDTPAGALAMGAADGLLVNGSVNNGAATPFAQFPAFGNNRRRPGSVYNGGFGVLTGNSMWDARPYSFSAQETPKPSYYDVHLIGTFGGPVKIPGVVRNNPTMFIGVQRTADHNATTQSARMPTALERRGDFSQTRDALGFPVQIADPVTGLPFPGGVIPQERISPQAAALLGYYPAPNLIADGRFNYQAPVLNAVTQYSLQSRLTQPVNTRNQLFGTLAYQRTGTDTTSLFGFEDLREVSAIDAAANWSHRISQFLSIRTRYQLTRTTTNVTPYFAGRTNVSGDAGITGNNQDPVNWGPPALVFSSGMAGLSDALHAFTQVETHAWSGEATSSRGRHFVTAGGTVRRHMIDIESQQDPRGMFSFTGATTGFDVADFMLGLPQTSAVAFGNADKYLRGLSYDAYLNDDFRVSPGLTINAGLRWEYESPLAERFGRLVNLDVADGFTAVAPVVASDPSGALTGHRYPDSLLAPDKRGLQPRLGMAWRPVAGSSLVVRAGYGIYRNTNVYQSIATLLAQQPPLSTGLSVETSPEHPLTLANGFIAPAGTANTFAVDPDFRVGFAHNWQASLQRDLPASLTVIGTYLGTRGSHLLQQFLPNTYPAGVTPPCATCPSGFIYLTSNGSSSRHAGQVQLRRRLRNGLTASAQYTLSKAEDDAAAFGGASLTGATIAQDWLDLEAEWGPSVFDQRHLLNLQFQYTTGVGVSGGTLLDGLRGALWKGWTVTSQLTAGSGTPLTPVYLTQVRGTGVSGTIRADVVGADDTPDGAYLNPANFAPPAPGQWGTAGRNSVTGPKQFALNAGIARTFSVGDRFSLDWRIDVTNLLNRVTFAGVNTLVGSPQFGLADRANQMRKLQSSLRLRF